MCSLKLELWAHSVQHGCLQVERESNPLRRSWHLLLLLWKIWKRQLTVLQNTAAIQSRTVKEIAGLITKSVTHSCDGGSDFSTLGVLKLGSGENTASSFFESVTAGCGASIIIEFRICKHLQCVTHAGNSHQWWEWPFLSPWAQPSRESHCQARLRPEASTHPGPAVVWRAAASGRLREIPLAGPTHSKATQKHSKGKRWTCVCGTYGGGPTLKIIQHLPSQWASPPWDHEPRSGMPRSRWVIWSDHTPSKKNRGDINKRRKRRRRIHCYVTD